MSRAIPYQITQDGQTVATADSYEAAAQVRDDLSQQHPAAVIQVIETVEPHRPTVYGYTRVSSRKQADQGNGLEAQRKALLEHGVPAGNITEEVYTGRKVGDRPKLKELLSRLETGDTLTVTRLDRIARTANEGYDTVLDLTRRGVVVDVLNMGRIEDTPMGRLMLHMLLAFSEFERDLILDRMQEGLEVAMQDPNFHRGRPVKYTTGQRKHAVQLLESHSYSEVERMTGIPRSTLARYKQEFQGKAIARKSKSESKEAHANE